jgi:hypothetical protein
MSKSKTRVPKYPTVKAYAPGPAILKDRPGMKTSWLVPCPFCERIHRHTAKEGFRNPHCPPDGGPHAYEFEGRPRPAGYTLLFAGKIDGQSIFNAADRERRFKYVAHLAADNAIERDFNH